MQTSKAQRLETLRQQQKAVNERVKLLEQWQRDEKRKEDTRQKILLGAIIKQEMGARPDIDTWMNRLLDERLTKAKDRALFGLPPLEGSAPVAKLGVGTLAAGEGGPAVVPFGLQPAELGGGMQPVRPARVDKKDPETPDPN